MGCPKRAENVTKKKCQVGRERQKKDDNHNTLENSDPTFI
jgi:hypothetical protein